VIPEFEVWHAGSIWNLNYLIEKKALRPPYVCTLFFGWRAAPGRATIENTSIGAGLMPQGSACNVSIMSKEQKDIIAAAILNGDHSG